MNILKKIIKTKDRSNFFITIIITILILDISLTFLSKKITLFFEKNNNMMAEHHVYHHELKKIMKVKVD